MRALLNRAWRIGHAVSRENLSLYAANAAFFLMLSVFPALLLLLSVLRPLHLEQAAQTLLLDQLIPQVLQPLLYAITEDLASTHTGSLISVSALLTLWSASRGIYGLLKGLDQVYHIREHRGYVRMRLTALAGTALFLLAILGTLSLYMLGGRLLQHLATQTGSTALLRVIVLLLRGRAMAGFVFLCATFSAVFRILPDHKGTWRQVLPGSLLAALGWMLFSWLFSFYTTELSNFSQLYGSVSLLALAMLWLYICLEILLLGGLLNYYLLPQQRHLRPWRSG